MSPNLFPRPRRRQLGLSNNFGQVLMDYVRCSRMLQDYYMMLEDALYYYKITSKSGLRVLEVT